MAAPIRQVLLALVGFLLGAVLLRLYRGTWSWETLAGAAFGAAIIVIVTLVWTRLTRKA